MNLNDLDLDIDSVVSGTESFRLDRETREAFEANPINIPFFSQERKIQKAIMAGPCRGQGMQKPPLLIRTMDNKNFRVYSKADLFFTQDYMTRMCRFLDTRTPDQTVTFILGAHTSDIQSHMVGSLCSTMMDCKAEVTTIAAGYCSITETILWCFGKKRDVYRYGALAFGVTEFCKYNPEFSHYYDVFFDRAVEIGILKAEDVEELHSTGKEKMILYNEYKSQFPDVE